MIYLFRGSDVDRVRHQAFAFVAAARKKQPDLEYIRLAREELSPEALEEVSLSGGLFVKRLLVLLDEPFPSTKKDEEEEESGEESGSFIEEKLAQLAQSENAILILAPKLSAALAKKITAKAVKEYVFDLKKQADAAGFNAALVNALASQDGKRLWLELVRAMRKGDAPEMLHGLLHWKARAMNDRSLSLALIGALQDARRSGADLFLSLEKFALSW